LTVESSVKVGTTDEYWNEVAETFVALAAISHAISKLYAAAPDAETLAGLHEMDSEDELLLSPDDPEWAEGLHLLAGYCRGGSRPKKALDAIADHSRLFLGPGHVLAPPWSSVYLDAGALNGPTTRKVAQLYKKYGLQGANPEREPEDHIGCELQFIGQLDRRIAEALADERDEDAYQTACELREFCVDHLRLWLEPFSQAILKNAETDFYRGLAKATKALVALQRQFLDDFVAAFDEPEAG
jgi:TorA maturation chaperone TorD